ncbi:MAG: histidine kinase [Verrucomicrobia bacterium]|nr:MAG: histidine kinase [Verrucomicrobiota bacterium]
MAVDRPEWFRWWQVPAYALLWTLVGMSFAGQHYLTSAKVGVPVGWGVAVASALADWYVFGVLALPAAWLASRFSLTGPHWKLRVAVNVVAGMVFSLLWILGRSALSQIFVPLRGAEKPFGEVLRYVLVATFFFNMLVYWMVVTGTHALAYYASFRDRERRVLELEGRLTSARLHALQMQLNPHFLFNALHGISTLMYRDVDRADSMLVRLAELLRHALDRSQQQTVTLREELAFLDRYLALEQMRFSDRLTVRREIDPALLGAAVPNLILQPLVENAIKHGLEPESRPGCITLRASRPVPGRLRLEVEDNGRGMPAGKPGRVGVGTANCRARLVQLYGTSARFELEPGSEGGVRAVIELPV